GRCLDGGGGRGNLFGAHRDNVSDHCLGGAEQPHRAGHRDSAGADALADHQAADVDLKVLGNFIRQALDLDFARDDLEQAALELDTRRLADRHNGNRDADALLEVDALQVGVNQIAANRIALLVHHHDGSTLAALDSQVENRVVAGLAVQDLDQLLGADPDGDRILVGAVNHGGNESADAQAAGFVLAAP